MNTLLFNKLCNTPELIADEHDGSYELVRSIVNAYRDVDKNKLDYNDLNAVYLMSVGTWKQGLESKRSIIDKSHLSDDNKAALIKLLDSIWQKAVNHEYSNCDYASGGGTSIGMFGTGFYSFVKNTDDKSVRAFIKMCLDILDMTNDDDMFNRAATVLTKSFKGMKAASASMVLHCLKPYAFPVLNSNMGSEDIFAALDIQLDHKANLDTYIDNCKRIKAFRDANFSFKNYRIIDMAAWELTKTNDHFEGIIKKYKESFETWIPEEIYKWQAVMCFQDNWDINAEDFAEMLTKSLSKSVNLLTSGYRYPKRMILLFAENEPDTVRNMFSLIFNEEIDLLDRIEKFKRISGELLEKYKNKDGMKQHYQDERSICQYLFFMYPDKYYMYQFGKLKEFADRIGCAAEIKQGDIQNVITYTDICDRVLSEVAEDAELLTMINSKLDNTCYADQNHHMLADDIVYFGSKLESLYWPPLSEYDPEISSEKWAEIIRNNVVFNATAMTIMKRIHDIGGEATCKQLSEKYGQSPAFYNMGSSQLAKRVSEATDCPLMENDNEDARWWPVLFTGRRVGREDAGNYSWKLRPELKEELKKYFEEVNPKMADFGKNTILYGPPGTGKTYETVNYSVAIIEDKPLGDIAAEEHSAVLERYNNYKKAGQIEFTTFHQSYGYEEFIEGIRPVFSSEGEDACGDISYEIASGVFKKFCERAQVPVVLQNDEEYAFTDMPTVWKVSLAGTGDNELRRYCMNNDCIRIGWDEYGPSITDETVFNVGGKNVLNAFINRMQENDIILSCFSEKTVDAVGIVEGGYEWHNDFSDYHRFRKVRWLVKGIHYDIVEMNQYKVMTLSTVYKLNISIPDIVKILSDSKGSGIKPIQSIKKNHVFIIDEINRGNISKIFGELITLIEPSKRLGQPESLQIRLPYSQAQFGVPDNVYIVGTMNTADRSIALIDTALRRRFNFIEMQPDIKVLKGIEVEGISIADMLAKINRRIEVLCNREHTLGHAYFTSLKANPSLEHLACIFEFTIIPLLQEYFYDDYDKIRLVLGDNNKPVANQFVTKEDIEYTDLFGNTDYPFTEASIFGINCDAFHIVDSYFGI